ncbi:MAG: APC family permease [Nonomuraea sp.]|nr:APC family permease [Nonomuraea sp.]
MTSIEEFGYRQELQRSLGFADLMIYGLIFMVPIAPFGIFGGVFSGSGGMVALAYIIGLVAMAFSGLSYAQMARAFPMAGSVYTYAGRGIGAPVGFVAGWMILLDYILVPSLLYLVAGVAMNSFVPALPVWAWIAIFVALNTAVNYLGIQMTARITRVMLAAELVVLAIFLIVGVIALANGKGTAGALTPLYDSATFSWSVVLGAASLAVLSFLGFDGISTLAEENREDARRLGRSMVAALALAAVLFVVQTWVAALLVPERATLLGANPPQAKLDNAFYDLSSYAGGAWLAVLTALATAIAWGFANALVAQAATSRLLFAMARDRQLPAFLSRISPKHKVPVNATFLVAALSLVIGVGMSLYDGGIALLGSMVNFGAMTAFLLLHVSVVIHYVVRQGSKDFLNHLILPVIGFAVLVMVVINADVAAQRLGFIWLGLGIILAFVLWITGRGYNLTSEAM